MDWLLANWLSILLGIAFVAMHMFMHGGHGGHGGHGSGRNDGEGDGKGSPAELKKVPTAGHQH